MAGVDIWDLAAKLSVDTAPADRALTEHQKKVLKTVDEYNKLQAASKKVEKYLQDQSGSTNKLSDAFKSLSSTAQTLQGPMGGVASRLTAIKELATSGAGVLGVFAVALAANIKIVYELHQRMLDLALSTAQWQGALTDLAQQTGVNVETLSAFGILAEQTGGNLDSIAASLGIFQKNLEEATNPLSKTTHALDELGVNTLETEAALRQTMAALAKMPQGFHQTALALELFGRGGKQVLAILKETGGDLDAAQAKFRAMGLEVSGPVAAAADNLNDKLVILDRQVLMLKASLGNMILPQVTTNVDRLTSLIDQNRTSVDQLSMAVGMLAAFLGSNLVLAINVAAGGLQILQANLAPLVAAIQVIKGLGGLTGNIPAQSLPGKVDVGAGGSVGAGIFRPKGVGGGGGRGGGGGGGGADAGLTLLKQLENQFKDLTGRTELQKLQDKLLDDQYKKTNDTIKKRIMVTQIEIDLMKAMQADFEKTVQLIQELGEKGEKGFVRARLAGEELNSEFQKMIDLVREAGEQGQAFFTRQRTTMDLTGLLGTGSTRKRSVADGATRPRIATVDRQVLQEQIEMFNDRMHQLAGSLTSIIDRSISEGFQHGVAAGVRSFAQGILEMMRSAALAALEKRLFDVFSKALGGGGGLFSTLFGIASGAATGSVTGMGAGTGGHSGLHFSAGGVVPGIDRGYDSIPAMLRPGETVIPRGQSAAGHTFVINLNVPNIEAAGSRATQYQVTRAMQAHLSKTALMG